MANRKTSPPHLDLGIFKCCDLLSLTFSSPGPIQFDTFQRPFGRDGGRPGPIQDECDLPEVVGGAESPDLDRVLALVSVLGHNRGALHNDEEIVARLALGHHDLAVLD